MTKTENLGTGQLLYEEYAKEIHPQMASFHPWEELPEDLKAKWGRIEKTMFNAVIADSSQSVK